jgi:hypothetical protein
MLKSVASNIKNIAIAMDIPEGDITKKYYVEPKSKPPRRNPSVDNKSNRSDYSKNYMKDYREQGKDYQKVPDKVKEYRRNQRKKFKGILKTKKPLTAQLIDQELEFWKKQGKNIPMEEFVSICDRRGFDENERTSLLEDLYDMNLILS